MSLKTELYEMIAEALAVDTSEVVDDAHLLDDLGADSLMLAELADAIGKKYGIQLEADDLMELEHVGELPELASSRMSQ